MYKTGDPHPTLNCAAFVDYCKHGCEIWTSVYLDTEAPHRLAKAREQSIRLGNSGCPRNSYRCGTVEVGSNQQQPALVAQPHTSLAR
jgi:hypothetical protein